MSERLTGEEAEQLLLDASHEVQNIMDKAVQEGFKALDAALSSKGHGAGTDQYPALMTTGLASMILMVTVQVVGNSRIRPRPIKNIFENAFEDGFEQGEKQWIGDDPLFADMKGRAQ